MNNLSLYNNISRFSIKGSSKDNTIGGLENLLKKDPSKFKKIIKTLIAFKYYRNQHDANKQLEALNKLDDLTKEDTGVLINKEILMELVKNRSYFIQRNIPKTFVNFLNELKNKNNAIFESVTREHAEFLKNSGVNCEKDVLNEAFIKKSADENDISYNNSSNLLKKRETESKINTILRKAVKGIIPNIKVIKADEQCIEMVFEKKNNLLLTIETDPISYVSVKELWDSIKNDTLDVCVIKRGNKWVIQDNKAMFEWFKNNTNARGEKLYTDPMTREKVILSGRDRNFYFGKDLLRFLLIHIK